MKVLIVDDESLVRRALMKAFARKGHEVFEAEDGLRGVESWKELQPDLVVLDVLMPGLSGPEVLREMRDQSKAKVVLISAYTGEYDMARAQAIGASLFLPKPFEDIVNVVELCEGTTHE